VKRLVPSYACSKCSISAISSAVSFSSCARLHHEILFRILAGAVLEVQVAQVLVELLLALQQIVEAGLLALAGEDVLRPEGVKDEAPSPSALRK